MKDIDEKILYKGKWLALKATTYKSLDGKEVIWESIERTNTVSAVVVLAKMVPSNRYIMIKQYRPAINNVIIGFPAGLLEDGDIEKEAIRELKEETGYVGRVLSVSPAMSANAALVSDVNYLVKMEIDEELEENQNPRQKLESEEEIEVLAIHRNKIREFLLSEKEKGTAIGVGPWYIFCENLVDEESFQKESVKNCNKNDKNDENNISLKKENKVEENIIKSVLNVMKAKSYWSLYSAISHANIFYSEDGKINIHFRKPIDSSLDEIRNEDVNEVISKIFTQIISKEVKVNII